MTKPFSEDPPARKVSDLMISGRMPIARLLSKARELTAIEAMLGRLLDPDVMQNIRCAGFDEGTLVLLTPSSAIATSLRFDEPELVQGLASLGVQGVERLRIRTAPLPDPAQGRR